MYIAAPSSLISLNPFPIVLDCYDNRYTKYKDKVIHVIVVLSLNFRVL